MNVRYGDTILILNALGFYDTGYATTVTSDGFDIFTHGNSIYPRQRIGIVRFDSFNIQRRTLAERVFIANPIN